MKKEIVVLTDTTSDLSPELIKQFNIGVIPLKVIFGEDTYLDQVEMPTSLLYENVEKLKALPKTAAASIDELIAFFKQYGGENKEIVMITIGEKLSSTYQNAVLASQEFPKGSIYVVNSDNLSTGIGLLAIKACRLRDKGLSAKKIADILDNDKANLRVSFAIEKMDYLHKGGRCSGLAFIVGTLLKIKPIIAVKDGKLIVAVKRRGSMSKALDYMIEELLEVKNEIEDDFVFITHTYGEESEKYIRARLEKEIKVENLATTSAGSVISSHCGKGTIGILYFLKNK